MDDLCRSVTFDVLHAVAEFIAALVTILLTSTLVLRYSVVLMDRLEVVAVGVLRRPWWIWMRMWT